MTRSLIQGTVTVNLSKLAARYDPSEAFGQLNDLDPAIRLLGAKWICKQAHGEVNFSERWLKKPETMTRLLPLLDDPDARVVEEILGAVEMIVERYRKDARPIPRAMALLSSERVHTRRRAVQLLTQFKDKSLAEPLLAMFNDPAVVVRAVVVQEIADPAERWPKQLREQVRQAALERLEDRAKDVRCSAAKLLVAVGNKEDVPILKQALKEMKGFNYRLDFRASIAELEKRLRTSKR